MATVFSVLLLTILFCAANAHIRPEEFGDFQKSTDEWHDICADVTGASDGDIFGMREGKFPEDEKVKRYTLCLWRLAKTADRNFNLNFELVMTDFPERMRDRNYGTGFEKCAADIRKSGTKENYEKIYQMEKCLYKLNPDIFIMF